MSDWIAFKDQEPAMTGLILVYDCRNGLRQARNWPGQVNLPGWTHWQPFPEPPQKPDPFEEWWGDPKRGLKLIAGYHVPKCEAQVIFTAGLEAGMKEK